MELAGECEGLKRKLEESAGRASHRRNIRAKLEHETMGGMSKAEDDLSE